VIEIFDCDQGSVMWFNLRLGIPTASCFGEILTGGKGKTRQSYLLKLAGEILTGEPHNAYVSKDMERGQAMEPEAREYYAFTTDADVKRVGFIRNGRKGCSPDGLIGNDGLLELKTAFPHCLIPLLLADEFPPEHKAQCQGALWVAEREWVDLAVYWPKMPLFKKRAYRDDGYIANLAGAVEAFNAELNETVERIRRLGEVESIAA
jgi:hypothetical protein